MLRTGGLDGIFPRFVFFFLGGNRGSFGILNQENLREFGVVPGVLIRGLSGKSWLGKKGSFPSEVWTQQRENSLGIWGGKN